MPAQPVFPGTPADPPADLGADLEADLEELERLSEELQSAYDDLPEEFRGTALQVGDCWGVSGGVDFDPRPCTAPHIYEVIAVVDDFDPAEHVEQGLDWLAELQAEQEARDELCRTAFADYFGYPYLPSDHGIAVEPTPEYPMEPNLVVCSAHSAPDVEYYRGEVEGSFADRGLTS